MDGRGRDAPDSDGALLSAAREGDMSSLGELFDRHRGMVLGVCAGVLGRSHLLADAVQEVFLKLLFSANEIQDPDRIGPWLGTVARNTAIDLLKSERGRERPEKPGSPASPLDLLVRDERQQAVLSAVMNLRPEYRGAILLRYLHSRSYREIAEALGVSVSAVETRLHRARKELAGILGAKHNEL